MARLRSLFSSHVMFFSLFMLILIADLGQCSTITITKNGYSGIVVAFSPRISQDVGEPLIPQIKELFKNASIALYYATRQMSYFKDVTILVPQAWENRIHYETAASEAFGQADIRIDEPNNEYGDGPYTLQPLGCGSEGLFIHLTPNYLKNLKTTSKTYFGDPGKTLVHEWAHLRYGIFDEFGYASNPMFPMAYYDDDNLVPNSCTNGAVEGVWMDVVNEAACIFDEDTGLPNDECVFLPDVDKNGGITSSLASYHFLKDVFTFCDDGEEHYHNELPQNKHNVLCESQSTWSVIQKHRDFYENNNLPNANVATLEPVFRIVQETVATYCLVLDISGSMNEVDDSGYTRLKILQDTVKRWLQEEVTLGSAVGIVTFSTTAEVVAPIRKITEQTREAIIKQIPTEAKGTTHIGLGMLKAIAELKRFRGGPGGIIILITDGQENAVPSIMDVIPQLQASQTRMVAIALHTQESPNLERAVEASDGKMFSVPHGAGTELLGMAFYEALTYQTSDYDLAQKIYTQIFEEAGENFAGSFAIDKTIGNDTTIDISTKHKIVNVTITGPAFVDDIRSASVVPESFVRFKYLSLKDGVYRYSIKTAPASAVSRIQVSVTSKARSVNTPPIITKSWIAQEPTSTPEQPRFVILAEVKQGNNPVINAAVMAKVDRPDKKSVLLQLFDNGNGAPDVTRHDGIYVRYFTHFGGKGRYGVTAQVTDDGKASIRDVGFTGSRSMPVTNKFQTRPKVSYKPTGTFGRESSSGSFTSEKDLTNDMDIFPPSRISDLHASFADDNSKVMLNWTAPGDDLDFGKASSYDIRYSYNRTQLSTNFLNANRLNSTSQPHPAGQQETYMLSIPHENKMSIFVALRASDDVGHTSKTSNIVHISKRPKVAATTSHPEDSDLKVDVLNYHKVIVEGKSVPQWIKDLIKSNAEDMPEDK